MDNLGDKKWRKLTHFVEICVIVVIVNVFVACSTNANLANSANNDGFITLKEQGSFAVGGVVIKNKQGKSYYSDHAYVFYQIPVNAKAYPMVFAHGIEQFSKTWESTPDGRDGFQNIFLRAGYGVYLVNQPRRGNSAKITQSIKLEPNFSDEMWFNIFRIGVYPHYFDGVQFPRDKASLEQMFRQSTSTIAPKQDLELYAKAYATLFDKIGSAIFITHSQGGPVGWKTALKTNNIKAIVSYEPGGEFPFPKGQMPELGRTLTPSGKSEGIEISREDFLRFTKFPIIIYYGDFLIKDKKDETKYPFSKAWTLRLELAREWAKLINANGGDAQVVHLPEIGIKGNTHFPFSDLNNAQIAELLKAWLKEKGLDK